MRACAFLLVLTTAGVGTVSAQSLADVARKESERRQATKESGKTYTNKDLKPVREPEPAPEAQAPTGGGAAAADAATTGAAKETAAPDQAGSQTQGAEVGSKPEAGTAADKDKADVKDEAWWSKRMADLRERLERDQTFLDALQSRINALTTDFVNRDDPAQRRQIGIDRDKALAELDRMRKAVEEDKRAIPELEDEARRAGVPPGWLR